MKELLTSFLLLVAAASPCLAQSLDPTVATDAGVTTSPSAVTIDAGAGSAPQGSDEPARKNGIFVDAGSTASTDSGSAPVTLSSADLRTMSNAEIVALAQSELAKKDAERAEAEKKRAQEEKRKKEEEAAQAKNARLLSYGINVGVALAFHTRFVRKHANQQQTVGLTALPYVMLLPGYWAPRRSRAQIDACVSSWGGGSTADAEAAATASARRDAANIYNAVERRLQLLNVAEGAPLDPTIAKAIAKRFVFGADEENHRTAAENEVFAIHDNRDPHLTEEQREQRKRDTVQSMADRMWKPGLNPNCGGLKGGFWFGFPTDYEADYKIKLDGKYRYTKAKMDPSVAFGVGFTPNTYISLLAGFTYGTLRHERDDGRDVSRRTWAFTSAIGGNLDIITTLVKKLTPSDSGSD